MTSNQTEPQQQSRTAQTSRDTIGLGRTPGQRGAEMIAGIRAEMNPTSESLALSRIGGRVVARVLLRLGQNRALFQFIPARMFALSEMIRRSIPENKEDLLIVEIAAGFSPRPMHIAQQFPKAQVIEVDLPDVVTEKQRRLKRSAVDLPPNLSWLTADLGVTNLHDVLEGRKADVIASEGLTLYFTAAEIIQMNHHLRLSLVDGGAYITEIYYRDKFEEARSSPQVNSAVSYFLRQAGHIPGLATNDEMARSWFTEAGFGRVETHQMLPLLTDIKQPLPGVDIATIVVARNGTAPAQPDLKATTPNASG
jgi:O-methyltransferase involved in polyketide biosynthesis